MRTFIYYSLHVETGTKTYNEVELFNEADFLRLLASWNYKSATFGAGFIYYPQTPPQVHDIPVGGR